jgi:hypothetical protein
MRTMMTHDNLAPAPEYSTDAQAFARFCSLYRQRQDALTLVKQLTQMIKAVQRHRGMSMALLGGNQLFRDDFSRLQQQLERRLRSLQTFASDTELLTERDRENLHSAWVTISHDWQQDSVIDNYELHCHLIEQLLAMLATLSKALEQPITSLLFVSGSPTEADSLTYPSRFKHLEVLHFTLRQMPAVVEQIGRVRALATYAAAIGHCDSHHDRKLRYVIQNTRVNNEKLRHQSKRLEPILQDDIALLSQLKSYELKLMFLLNMVDMDVLNGTGVNADSNRIFSLATDIIDVYLNVVEDGILLISRWHEDELENWLQQT